MPCDACQPCRRDFFKPLINAQRSDESQLTMRFDAPLVCANIAVRTHLRSTAYTAHTIVFHRLWCLSAIGLEQFSRRRYLTDHRFTAAARSSFIPIATMVDAAATLLILFVIVVYMCSSIYIHLYILCEITLIITPVSVNPYVGVGTFYPLMNAYGVGKLRPSTNTLLPGLSSRRSGWWCPLR